MAMRKSHKEPRARIFTSDGHPIIPCTVTDRSETNEEIEPYVSKPEMRRPFRDDRGTEQRRDSPAQEAAERGRPARDVGIQVSRGRQSRGGPGPDSGRWTTTLSNPSR